MVGKKKLMLLCSQRVYVLHFLKLVRRYVRVCALSKACILCLSFGKSFESLLNGRKSFNIRMEGLFPLLLLLLSLFIIVIFKNVYFIYLI